jgi:hypothetical protein
MNGMAEVGKGYLALAKCIEAQLVHSDVRKRLSDTIQDKQRAGGSYGGYIDHTGDGESGDCIYSQDGDIRKAGYTLGTANGKQTADIDTENSTNVVPVTTYEEEADDDDQYAGMEAAGLYTKGPIPLIERFISKDERSSMDDSDFAGKNKSYPINKPGDIPAAVHSMGRAGPTNYGMAQLKANIIRIAKKKGWAKYLPKTWQGGSDDKEAHVPRGTSGIRLMESAALSSETLRFSEAGAINPLVKIISAGRGSSGYYTKDLLERDGPKIFKRGTLMYINHATEAEEAARPEGDYSKLAAVTTDDAYWDDHGKDGPALYAPAKVFSGVASEVAEKAPYTGVSIRASGEYAEAKSGQPSATVTLAESKIAPDGKPGLIGKLTYADSIDLVTKAGRDGKLLLESADYEGDDMTEAEVKRLIESANRPLMAENRRLRETIVRTTEAPAVIRDILAGVRFPPQCSRVICERIARHVSAEDIPLTEAGALDRKKLAERVMEFAKQEAADLEAMGFGAVQGLGVTATEDPVKAGEAWDKELADTMKQLATVVIGEGDEFKDRRKAFREGRAA